MSFLADNRFPHLTLSTWKVERQLDVTKILDWCDGRQIPMGLASRTEQPTWARELIGLLDIQHRFAFAEIYPTSKLRHFRALTEDSGVDYERMLFFDDEMRNIREVGELGVSSIFVENGLDWSLFTACSPIPKEASRPKRCDFTFV